MTLKEASKHLGLPQKYIKKCALEGELQYKVIDKKLNFNDEELIKWWDDCLREAINRLPSLIQFKIS